MAHDAGVQEEGAGGGEGQQGRGHRPGDPRVRQSSGLGGGPLVRGGGEETWTATVNEGGETAAVRGFEGGMGWRRGVDLGGGGDEDSRVFFPKSPPPVSRVSCISRVFFIRHSSYHRVNRVYDRKYSAYILHFFLSFFYFLMHKVYFFIFPSIYVFIVFSFSLLSFIPISLPPLSPRTFLSNLFPTRSWPLFGLVMIL